MTNIPDWHVWAACAGSHMLMFPESSREYRWRANGKSPTNREIEWAAIAICDGCIVKAECLEDGIDEEYGVRGGLTGPDRRRLRGRRREQARRLRQRETSIVG